MTFDLEALEFILFYWTWKNKLYCIFDSYRQADTDIMEAMEIWVGLFAVLFFCSVNTTSEIYTILFLEKPGTYKKW